MNSKLNLFVIIVALVICSCNNQNGASTVNTADSSTAAKLDYAYTMEKLPDWQWGDPANIVTATKALKAYENGNIDESASYFGDTARLEFDYYKKTLVRDSVKQFFKESRSQLKNMKINMKDWESVISKNKGDQYVTLWYQQIFEDLKGNIDSFNVVNDLKFLNGKIVLLSETIRHYPKN